MGTVLRKEGCSHDHLTSEAELLLTIRKLGPFNGFGPKVKGLTVMGSAAQARPGGIHKAGQPWKHGKQGIQPLAGRPRRSASKAGGLNARPRCWLVCMRHAGS